MDESPSTKHPISLFLEEKAGASMYEYALLAALAAVVGIIVLVALSMG